MAGFWRGSGRFRRFWRFLRFLVQNLRLRVYARPEGEAALNVKTSLRAPSMAWSHGVPVPDAVVFDGDNDVRRDESRIRLYDVCSRTSLVLAS